MKKNKSNLPTLQARHKVKQTLAEVRLRYNIRRRPADETDFQRICKGERIFVIRHHSIRKITGLHCYYKKIAFIVLHPALKGDEFLWVAYHELGHHFLHLGKGTPLHDYKPPTPEQVQAETEAEYFAEQILMRKVGVKFNAEK